MNQPTVKPQVTQLAARDEVAALARVAGDADLARELFEALVAGLPDEINDLRACLAESDWPGLAEHAHQIHGATRYCGVPALDEAIGSLERAARIGDPELIQRGFDRVEAEFERLLQAAG